MRVSLVALVSALSLISLSAAGAAFAGSTTTSPSKYIQASVVINDKGIIIGLYQGTRGHGDSTPLGGAVPRGDFVSFFVINVGKKVHNFTIFGKKTKPIKPGGKAHLFVAAMTRGTFPFRSTIDKGRLFRGSISVA